MQKKYFVPAKIDKIITKIVNDQMKKRFIPGKSRIKYAGMMFDKSDIESSVNSILSSFSNNWFALGQNAEEFQRRLAHYLGLKKTIFVNSGSSANLVAVAALFAKKRVKRGDEAITIATTFPTTINPILIYGLKPVLVDVKLPSYTVNLGELERAITAKTRLIILPHINGSPHNMVQIMEIAQKHNLSVIEDCCDALGSKYNNKFVGTFGNLGTYSFYAAHHISTGEGGAVGGNDEDLLLVSKSIRDWGRANLKSTLFGMRKLSLQKVSKELPEDYEDRYTYVNIGYNLKPLDMQAALGINQLKKLERFGSRRRKNHKFLFENLLSLTNDLVLPEGLEKADPSWFTFPITIKNNSKFKRMDLVKYLENRNIETRTLLAGDITKHPAYDDVRFRKVGKLSTTTKILQNGFVIGTHPGLRKEELEFIVACFKKFFMKFR